MKSPRTEKKRLDRITVKAITEVAAKIENNVARMRKPRPRHWASHTT